MFCSNCGMEIEEGIKFCSYCGASLDAFQKGAKQSVEYQPKAQQPSHSGPYQQSTVYYQTPQAYLPHKSEVVALILSWFVFPGLGHIYAGKIGRGLGFLFGLMGGGIVVGVSAMWIIWYAFPLLIVLIVGLVVIQIWCLVDSYQTAGKYNKFVARTGRAPQPGDVW